MTIAVADVTPELHDHITVVMGPSAAATILIAYTELWHGGARPWLLCPLCETRRGKLLVFGDVIVCRICVGARHASQERRRLVRYRRG